MAVCASPLVALFALILAAPAAALGPKKFELWSYQWGTSVIRSLDDSPCADTVRSYWNPPANDTTLFRCEIALNCLLSATSEASKQMISSSAVLLGLTPAVLAGLSPSIGESSMLAFRRPWLSLLLSLGAPAVAGGARIWTYDDPFDTLRPAAAAKGGPGRCNGSMLLDFVPFARTARFRWLVQLVEYVAAVGAIANVIHISLQLGWRSVSSFDCESSYYPLAWVLIPVGIHLVGALSFYLRPKTTDDEDDGAAALIIPLTRRRGRQPRQEQRVVTITASAPTPLSLIAYSFAVGFSVGHILFGMLVFSSLMFLMVSDVVPVIMRYAASAIVCRFINQYELALMGEEYRVQEAGSVSAGTAEAAAAKTEDSSDSRG